MSERETDPMLEAAQVAADYLVTAVLHNPERLGELDDLRLPGGAQNVLTVMRRLAGAGMPIDYPHLLTEIAKESGEVRATHLGNAMSGLATYDGARFDGYLALAREFQRKMRVVTAATNIALGARKDDPIGDSLAELEAAITEQAAGKKSHAKLGGDWFGDGDSSVVPIWGTPDRCAWSSGEGFMICGRQGTGKTTLLGQLLFASLGLIDPEVLGMPVAPAGRVGYIAADRPRQIKRAHARLWKPEHADVLNERLIVWEGPFDEDLAERPDQLVRWAQANRLDRLYLDSLKDLAVKLSDDAVGARINRAFQLCVREGIELGINHHQVKRNSDGKEPDSLADVYGSNWITSGLGSVLYLGGNPGDLVVKVKHLKQPGERIDAGGLTIEHDHRTGFSRVESQVDPLRELRRAAHGMTARALAQIMTGKSDPDKNETKRATRELERLVRDGFAVRDPGQRGGAAGGQASVFFNAAQDERPEATALQPTDEEPF